MSLYLNDKRAVVHLDLDTFFVSVERIRDRRLANRPLIIGGTGRGVELQLRDAEVRGAQRYADEDGAAAMSRRDHNFGRS